MGNRSEFYEILQEHRKTKQPFLAKVAVFPRSCRGRRGTAGQACLLNLVAEGVSSDRSSSEGRGHLREAWLWVLCPPQSARGGA